MERKKLIKKKKFKPNSKLKEEKKLKLLNKRLEKEKKGHNFSDKPISRNSEKEKTGEKNFKQKNSEEEISSSISTKPKKFVIKKQKDKKEVFNKKSQPNLFKRFLNKKN